MSRDALLKNLEALRTIAGESTQVAPVIKANAYGHGITLCAEVYAEANVPLLCVNDLTEAEAIAHLGPDIYVLGPTFTDEAHRAARIGAHVVSSSQSHVDALASAGVDVGRDVPVHVKFEVGTHRQGLPPREALELCGKVDATRGVRLAGVTTHLSDVEDETEHTYAISQIARFVDATRELPATVTRHCAASAAHIVLPQSRMDMARLGIACYGLWPSSETRISSQIVHGQNFELKPALTWKTRIVQLGDAELGSYVGYGRSHRVSRQTRLALLPVGYYDGYDRGLSNEASVLIRGQRCPVRGRVCMNMTIVDVTHVPDVEIDDDVTLIGEQGEFTVSAAELASHLDTIHYEVVSRIHPRVPRVLVA